MPARKGSKKLVKKQLQLGQLQKNKKLIHQMEEKLKIQTEKIASLQKLINDNDKMIACFQKELSAQESKKSDLMKKNDGLKMEIENTKFVMTNNLKLRDEKYKINITQRAVKKSKEVLKIFVLIEALCPIQQSKTYPYNFPFTDQTKTLHQRTNSIQHINT